MNRIPTEQVVESFQRCATKESFLERFYQMFLESSAEVTEKFRKTDFTRQRQMLKESLFTLLAGGNIPESGPIRAHLDRVARRHGRSDLDISPMLYDLWLDCLIEAVREHDPEFTEELGEAWRESMRPGIAFMRSKY